MAALAEPIWQGARPFIGGRLPNGFAGAAGGSCNPLQGLWLSFFGGLTFRPHPSNVGSSSLTSRRKSVNRADSSVNRGGATDSTGMLAAKRHAGVHTPAIACKKISANTQLAYAA